MTMRIQDGYPTDATAAHKMERVGSLRLGEAGGPLQNPTANMPRGPVPPAQGWQIFTPDTGRTV